MTTSPLPPGQVRGVLLANNTFTLMKSFTAANPSGCTGSASAYAPGTCSGIVLRNNTCHGGAAC